MTDHLRTAAEIRAELERIRAEFATFSEDKQRLERNIFETRIAALEWALSAPAPEAMSDAALVEAMAKSLARQRCGLVARHEIRAWVNSHWNGYADDARAALAVARQHIGQEANALKAERDELSANEANLRQASIRSGNELYRTRVERDELRALLKQAEEAGKIPLSFMDAMKATEQGLERWKAKPHNAKWWKRIDGTPIPNDLCVNIAEVLAGIGGE